MGGKVARNKDIRFNCEEGRELNGDDDDDDDIVQECVSL